MPQGDKEGASSGACAGVHPRLFPPRGRGADRCPRLDDGAGARGRAPPIVPAAYLERAASKASPADARPSLRALAERLRADAQPMLAGLGPERRATDRAPI